MSETPGEYKADAPAKPAETAPPLDLEAARAAAHAWLWPQIMRGTPAKQWEKAWDALTEAFLAHGRSETARLRGLLERLHAVGVPRSGEVWCAACSANLKEPHFSTCPWPELEAAVLSWRPAGGR